MATLSDDISGRFLDILKGLTWPQSVSIIRAGDNGDDRGAYIIVLDVADAGGYDNIPGGILENATCSVALLSHTTDDPDGSKSEALKLVLSTALWGLQTTVGTDPVGEWIIRYISPWKEQPISLDGAYRRTQLSANFILQNKNY